MCACACACVRVRACVCACTCACVCCCIVVVFAVLVVVLVVWMTWHFQLHVELTKLIGDKYSSPDRILCKSSTRSTCCAKTRQTWWHGHSHSNIYKYESKYHGTCVLQMWYVSNLTSANCFCFLYFQQQTLRLCSSTTQCHGRKTLGDCKTNMSEQTKTRNMLLLFTFYMKCCHLD